MGAPGAIGVEGVPMQKGPERPPNFSRESVAKIKERPPEERAGSYVWLAKQQVEAHKGNEIFNTNDEKQMESGLAVKGGEVTPENSRQLRDLYESTLKVTEVDNAKDGQGNINLASEALEGMEEFLRIQVGDEQLTVSEWRNRLNDQNIRPDQKKALDEGLWGFKFPKEDPNAVEGRKPETVRDRENLFLGDKLRVREVELRNILAGGKKESGSEYSVKEVEEIQAEIAMLRSALLADPDAEGADILRYQLISKSLDERFKSPSSGLTQKDFDDLRERSNIAYSKMESFLNDKGLSHESIQNIRQNPQELQKLILSGKIEGLDKFFLGKDLNDIDLDKILKGTTFQDRMPFLKDKALKAGSRWLLLLLLFGLNQAGEITGVSKINELGRAT